MKEGDKKPGLSMFVRCIELRKTLLRLFVMIMGDGLLTLRIFVVWLRIILIICSLRG